MKFADRLKFNATGTNAATITAGAAFTGCRTLAQVIASSDNDMAVNDAGVPFTITDGTAWEDSLFTVTSTTVLTRTSVLASSAGGTTPATFSGPLTVFNDPPGSYLQGQPLADYVAANAAGTLQNTDQVPIARGSALLGTTLLALAAMVAKLWPTTTEVQVTINSTASLPLDYTTHNRKRLICVGTPSAITAPSTYSNVGDGFSCKIENLSGAAITLSGMTVRPSGSTIPVGGSAEVFATGGSLYANVGGTVSAGGTGTPPVVPGQVTGLTAGTAAPTSQPLTWAAPATGTAPFTYKVEHSANGGTSWTTDNTSVSGTSYTVTGLTAGTSYQYRVSALNAAGTGSVSAVVTAATPATVSAPFSVGARTNFPKTMQTFHGDYYWEDVNTLGAATIVSVSTGLSESNTVAPTSATTLSGSVGSRGYWFGAATQSGSPASTWISNNTNIGQSVPATINVYFWTIVTDSNGATWKFVFPNAIALGDNVTTSTTGVAMNATYVP